MTFNNTSKAADKRSQKRATMKAGKLNAMTTSEITLRKQGAYDLMKQRHKFRLRMPG